jgi:hypothetical protein
VDDEGAHDTDESRRRVRRAGLLRLIAGVLVVAALGVVVFLIVDAVSDDDDPASTATTVADDGAVDLPQNPSLALTLIDDVWQVVNDGNVTMSDIEVRDADGAVLCSIDQLAPEDSEPCEEAGDSAGVVVVGAGPQGQRVEVAAP